MNCSPNDLSSTIITGELSNNHMLFAFVDIIAIGLIKWNAIHLLNHWFYIILVSIINESTLWYKEDTHKKNINFMHVTCVPQIIERKEKHLTNSWFEVFFKFNCWTICWSGCLFSITKKKTLNRMLKIPNFLHFIFRPRTWMDPTFNFVHLQCKFQSKKFIENLF